MLRSLKNVIRTLFAAGVALPAAFAAPIAVTTSFTIPADIAREVGGAGLDVRSLTPPNGDFHALQLTPAQVRAVSEADLVVAIHPQVEPWIDQLEKAGTLKRPVLYLAKNILRGGREHGEHKHGAGCACHAGGEDSHVWMNPDNVATMGRTLAARLADIDPDHAAAHRAAGEAYAKRINALSLEIARTLADIPPENRKLFSRHNNLSHFAKKFDFSVSGTLLQSGSSEASDPSAKTMARLVADLRKSKARAIFADNTGSADLLVTVAAEAGLPPPVTLFTDALDKPGAPASTYEGMMRENARRIAKALSGR